MSECVVRMEMPENCETCRFRVNDSPTNVPNWICAINQWPTFYCKKSQNHANEDKYLHDCPIICSLPEGHGRLGDLDALIELMLERKQPLVGVDSSKDRYRYMQWLADYYAIKDAKTIVPAERRREK